MSLTNTAWANASCKDVPQAWTIMSAVWSWY